MKKMKKCTWKRWKTSFLLLLNIQICKILITDVVWLLKLPNVSKVLFLSRAPAFEINVTMLIHLLKYCYILQTWQAQSD